MLPEIRSILANAGLEPEQIHQCQITWVPPKDGASPKLLVDYQLKPEHGDSEIKRAEAPG